MTDELLDEIERLAAGEPRTTRDACRLAAMAVREVRRLRALLAERNPPVVHVVTTSSYVAARALITTLDRTPPTRAVAAVQQSPEAHALREALGVEQPAWCRCGACRREG